MAQARRTGKHIGRPSLRKFHLADIERMRHLRSEGASVRKLAKDFETTQWMVARVTDANAAPIQGSTFLSDGWWSLTRRSLGVGLLLKWLIFHCFFPGGQSSALRCDCSSPR